VLVTDGEDLEGQGIDAARAAAKDGLVIYTVGVGTGSGGLIPVPNGNGGTDFVRDASGNFVKSHLDETTLSQIAEATGGMYQPLGQQGQGLGVIYDKALASMPKHDVASRRAKVYAEQYAWPLAAGLTLLLASMLIGTRRRGVRQGPRFAPARTAAGATALLALLSVPTLAHASAHSAESAYKKGQYDKAVSQFQDAAAQQPDVAPLQYDLGAAAYKSGQYDTALPAFQKALGSDDPALQQKAYYNIGNTEYRVGQKTVKAAPQETIKAWQNAVQSYDAALKLKADDADAKFNRDFVEKKLEKLEKEHPQPKQQQNQQQQQQQQQQDQQQQNQQNQQNQNQQQNQQNQNQQDQQNQQGGQQGQPNQNQPQNGQNQAQNQPKNPNGQQPPSAADPNKQNGQQPQQTAGSQDQKQGGQQKQDQQNGNGQQQQTAQNQPKDGGAKDQAASADKDKQSGAEADASLPAGELTKEQAKDLLNSLKGEEHILPVAADTRSAHPKDQPVLKDW
jgi:Ca-activated chloride channel family protein